MLAPLLPQAVVQLVERVEHDDALPARGRHLEPGWEFAHELAVDGGDGLREAEELFDLGAESEEESDNRNELAHIATAC